MCAPARSDNTTARARTKLGAAYEDTDLFATAVAEAHGRAQLGHSRHEGELAALDAELAKVDAGIDRYLRAFETGAMPEAICGGHE